MKNTTHELIGTIGVRNEMTENLEGEPNLGISVGVSSNGEAVISFGSKFSIRIPEDDVDAFRDILHDASRKLMNQRVWGSGEIWTRVKPSDA